MTEQFCNWHFQTLAYMSQRLKASYSKLTHGCGLWIAIKWANDSLVKSTVELDHPQECAHILHTDSDFFLCFSPVLFLTFSKIQLNRAIILFDCYVFTMIKWYI